MTPPLLSVDAVVGRVAKGTRCDGFNLLEADEGWEEAGRLRPSGREAATVFDAAAIDDAVEVDRDEMAAHDVLCCGVLRCVAVCCGVLQCVLQCVAVVRRRGGGS